MIVERIAEGLAERLDGVSLSASRVLDVGCGTGSAFAELRLRFPGAEIAGADWSAESLALARESYPAARLVLADATALPLADGSADVVWSNLCGGWREGFLPEMSRVLVPGGLLVFSTLGRDTLREAREALVAVAKESGAATTGGHLPPMFPDMHDIGDALLRSGFAEPVMEAELITFLYRRAESALDEAREWAGFSPESEPGSERKSESVRDSDSVRDAVCAEYHRRFARDDGLVPATCEAIYGMAWRRESDADPGESPVRFVPNI